MTRALLISLLGPLAIILSPSGSPAQTTAQLGLGVTYDGNAYRSADPTSDYITRTSLSIARDLARDELSARLFYDAGLDLSAEEGGRRSHEHRIGLSARRALAGDGDFVNAGATFSVSRHAGDLDLTNSIEGAGFVSVRLRSGEERVVQLGGRLRHRAYAELPEFTHTEGLFYGRLSLSPASKTSVILYGSFGLKSFSGSTSTGSSVGGSHHRRGGMGSAGGDLSGDAAPLLDQVTGSITLGQSLDAMTGLSFSYLRRFSVNADSYPVYPIGDIWYEPMDDELFDDPYSYECHEVSTVLTRLLPGNSSARLGYEFSVRSYFYEALDQEGEPLPDTGNRADHRHLAWLNLGKTFTTGSTPGDIRVFFEFTYLDNRSNDPYFDYTDSMYALGTFVTF